MHFVHMYIVHGFNLNSYFVLYLRDIRKNIPNKTVNKIIHVLIEIEYCATIVENCTFHTHVTVSGTSLKGELHTILFLQLLLY